METTRNLGGKCCQCGYYLRTQVLELGNLRSEPKATDQYVILVLPFLYLNFLIIKMGTEVPVS